MNKHSSPTPTIEEQAVELLTNLFENGLTYSLGLGSQYKEEKIDEATAKLTLLITKAVLTDRLKRIDSQMKYLQGYGAVIQLGDLSMERMEVERGLKATTQKGKL